MARKIALFSDGTGNSSGKAQKTNVWRLFQAIDQTTPEQIAKYDDGVGTSSNKYLAAIGGAFGWGLKRIVIDLYKFVCRNYEVRDEVHDDIYGFGFSRGAFTIRVLVDLIATEGLVTFRSEEELKHNAAAAYRHYRSVKFSSRSPIVLAMRWLRDVLLWMKDRIKGYRSYAEIAEDTRSAGRKDVPIRFLGLWDTVEAYGMPIEELKRGIDWVLWPMLFGDFILSPSVKRACHALSLDDERTTFHPLLWDEVAEARMVAENKVEPGRITQVWFAGVHSNVGGGYPEDQLSLVSLEWMMTEASKNGLVLMDGAVAQVARDKSAYARLYDSRGGLGAYYRYAPREIRVRNDGKGNRILPIIHGSVIMRMSYGSDDYSPITLPHEFWVLAPDGSLLPMEGAPLTLKRDQAKKVAEREPLAAEVPAAVLAEKSRLELAIQALARPDREEVRLVWDTVFWRRCLYLLTVVLSAVLVAYPWLKGVAAGAVDLLLRSVPFVGEQLHAKWQAFSQRVDHGAHGPVASVVDTLSGFIPESAGRWVDAAKEHPLEFGLLVLSVMVCMVGSSILEGRIHDRARLAWHSGFREDYEKWCSESQKGWRNGVLVATVLSVAGLVAALFFGTPSVQIELALLTAVLLALIAVRTLGKRPAEKGSTTAIAGTFALSFARWLRRNRLLAVGYDWLFHRTVPILFALLILGLGWSLANRALFDLASTSGRYCKGSVAGAARDQERLGRSDGEFVTRDFCWPSGLVLKKGERYRITLETPGDWFDASERADVIGFPAGNVTFAIATLFKRWWWEPWFRPIARIDSVGNYEYVLDPVEPIRWEPYSTCADVKRAKAGARISDELARSLLECAPTPPARRILRAELSARTSGELFLYVNDAVVMWPGASEFFYANNRGTARVAAERITGPSEPK